MTDEQTQRLMDLRAESFRVGARCSAELGASQPSLDLEIQEVARHGGSYRDGGAFSVLFSGSNETPLEQAMYRLDIDHVGVVDLLLVPISQDEKNLCYEAVFA